MPDTHRVTIRLSPELLKLLEAYQAKHNIDSLAAAVVSAAAKGLDSSIEPVPWGGKRPGAGRKKQQ